MWNASDPEITLIDPAGNKHSTLMDLGCHGFDCPPVRPSPGLLAVRGRLRLTAGGEDVEWDGNFIVRGVSKLPVEF